MRDFQTLVDVVPDALVKLDSQGLISLVNAEAERLLGRSRDHLLGHPLQSLLPDFSVSALCGDAMDAANSATVTQVLTVRRGGEELLVEARIRPALLDGARSYYASLRDISQRMNADRELRESQQRLQLLVHRMPAVLWTTDRELHFTFADGAGLAGIDLTPGQLIGQSLAELCESRSSSAGETQLLAAHHRALNGEAVAYEATWGERSFHAHVEPLRSPSGAIEGVLGVALDVTERQRAEAALRESGERHRLLTQQASDAIFVADRNWRYSSINPQATALLGYQEAELLGLHLGDIIAPEDLAAQPIRLDALSSGETVRSERRLVRKDGSRVPVEISSRLLPDGRFQAIVRDITQRKASEQALRESEARYRLLVETAYEGVWAVDAEGRTTYVNERMAELLGCRPEEMWGQLSSAFFEPALLPDAARLWERRKSGVREQVEFPLRRKDGSQIWCLCSQAPLYTEDGSFNGALSMFTDITERRSAEAALRASEARLKSSEARFRAICEASPVGIFLTDQQGECVYTNPAMQRQLGLPPDESLGWGWTRSVHPDDVDLVNAAWAQATPQSENVEIDHRLVHADGTTIHVVIRAAPIWEDSRCMGYVGTSMDVTERLSLGEQLRQSQKLEAIGRLAGGVAHDFNNMVAVVAGYSDLCLGRLGHDDPLRPFITQIQQAGERAATLTRQLLAFSRKQILEPRTLDLRQVVLGIHLMVSRLIGEDIHLVTDLAPNLGAVRADPGQMEQVLVNLCVNARDAMPRGGNLVIAAYNTELDEKPARAGSELPRGKCVALEVRDTGCGMSPETLARIFEPFYTTKPTGQGTGLGLAMAYGIVKQSGGHIEVESAVGEGTTFRIYLPRLVEASLTPAASASSAAPRGTERVLVVEDEPMVRDLIQTILQTSGYDVVTAADGAAALRLFQQADASFQVLITDVVMPGISGRELAEQLRSRCPQLRVLYMSGYTDDAMIRHGIEVEQTAFIQKPFAPAALAHKLREVLS